MLRSHITIALCLLALIAGLTSCIATLTSDALSFQTPDVPQAFKNRNSPRIDPALDGAIYFENGEDFYLANCRRGWMSCRQHFYNGQSLNVPEVDPDFDASLPWDWEHCKIAYCDGYRACKKITENLPIEKPILFNARASFTFADLISFVISSIITFGVGTILTIKLARTAKRRIHPKAFGFGE